MPIDGHAYLVKQGWGGKGTGLRHGAIARPVTVTQKKTLSGVGKDRDEAFPFWDHVFEAAAMSIQVKISKDSDDDDSDSDAAPAPTLELKRTKTGMISHRQHKTGTSALSGAGTPDSPASGSVTPRLSVMAAAKQEAAKRMLYANFFRGPVLGPMAPDGSSSSKSPEAIIEAAPDPEAKESDSASKKKGKERAAEPSPNVQDHALEKVETADEDKTSKEKRRRKWESKAEEGERKEKKRRKRQAEQTSADEIGCEGGAKT
ncbi:hypothetical protein C8Q72DRAFT_182455 [Fomitopsis betulina]|nr:hypothetical protein C8Q72DRAFT_182455 [Fomitopsis betulina]